MKNRIPRISPKDPVILKELHHRLIELEAELRNYPSRSAGERPLKAVKTPADSTIGAEKVVQFTLSSETYAAGHTDVTYSGSNHARGVRNIRFYQLGQVKLHIEGDFEDQQFGSNFRFQTTKAYIPGEWEKPFIKLTDELRAYREERRIAFRKKREAKQPF